MSDETLAKEIAYVHTLHAKYFGPSQPFYWTAVSDDPKVSAPSGWYQWTESGLRYIGPTIVGHDWPNYSRENQ